MNALREFLRHSGPGHWGLALSVLLVLAAVCAPLLAPANLTAQNLPMRLATPGPATGWARMSSAAILSPAFSMARAFRCW